MQFGSDLYLYHEKQDAGLCAVHALNALLQGPYFSEIDLMHIAREFDEYEHKIMLESGADSKDFLKFMAEDSGNIAEDGNYSIQVVAKALEVWGLSPILITNPDAASAKANPLKETAFICNLQSHWMTVRKIGDDWYNLNSLLSEPDPLSAFHLSAFLDTLMMRGYSIFVIRGNLPAVIPDREAIKDKNWKKIRVQKKKAESQSFDHDRELEEALMQSELEQAIQASLQPSPKVQKVEAPPTVQADTEDAELLEAIEMSRKLSGSLPPAQENVDIGPEPEKGPDVNSLMFRLPDGSRAERRFSKDTKIQSLVHYLKSKGVNMTNKRLISTFPRKEYTNLSQSLTEAGLASGTVLLIENM